MALSARLKLAHKLLICSALFLLPLAVLLYYTVAGFQQQIRFTGHEIEGARAVRPLVKLTVLLAGGQSDRIAAAVDSLFAEIRSAETNIGPLLPDSADRDARALKDARLHPAEAEAARRELSRQLYPLFTHLAETANLILDPELDSYYLGDLALLHMPSLHDALSRDPAAVPDPTEMKAVEHAVEMACAENRRKHRTGNTLETDLQQALAAFQSPAGAKRLEAASTLWETAVAHLAVLLDERAAALRRKQLMALALSLTAAGLAAGMLYLVIGEISAAIAAATRIAGQIAAGQLRSAETSLSQLDVQKHLSAENGRVRNEALRLFQAFGTMERSLDSLLAEVRKADADVDESTAKMTVALKEVEATFAEQAAATAQVAASSKEISATVAELAKSMRAVTGMAAEAAKLANTALDRLGGINTAMQESLQGAASVSGVLNAISAKAADIAAVLGAVTKIANRTNLISLNAGIEAEKAGEHAAGFTAVALEIRRVADQTAIAALDIEKMLADMKGAVDQGAHSISDYAERLRSNSATVASITADIGRSIECTRTLEPHFQTVDSGMQMQAQAAREILRAMQLLSAAAEQSRNSLSRFAEIAEHVRATVNVLKSEVAHFSAA